MKGITVGLMVVLMLVLPSGCLGQSTSQSKTISKPGSYAAPKYFGYQLDITLVSGITLQGILMGWQSNDTVGMIKDYKLVIGTPQTGERYIELAINNSIRKILFSEIADITVFKMKNKRSFFQKIGHGFKIAGQVAGWVAIIALYYAALPVDLIIHGGKPQWELP